MDEFDEFLSIVHFSIDDDDTRTAHIDLVPAQANAFAPDIGPAQVDMPILVDSPTQAVAAPWTYVPPRANVPAQEDYEVVAKRTRSTSAHVSTWPTKKPCCFLTIELATELPSPQRALLATAVATDVYEPIVATQEPASGATHVVSELAVIIVTGESTNTITSPPVMLPAIAMPPAVLPLD